MSQAIMCEYCERATPDLRAHGVYSLEWIEVQQGGGVPQHFCSLLHLLAYQTCRLRWTGQERMLIPGVVAVELRCSMRDNLQFWATLGDPPVEALPDA